MLPLLSSHCQSCTERLESSDQSDVASDQEELATPDSWKDAINKVVPAVVVLRFTVCRSFDTDHPYCGVATGFVVDKRRGIILTNRHVVKPGPAVARAIFESQEEVPVRAIYRDPVHDFGFLRYNPDAIQFLKYEEIPLAPEAACVGLEIRVVGNDSGEKVSILAGTLARLNRNSPKYKKDTYNDFNTFYFQAASGTKGGSSGSPVIDRHGQAVALNAGEKIGSSLAFYLPLDRVVRALKLLQKHSDSYADEWKAVCIPRGTLQVTFLHKGFDETCRLGVQNEIERMVRQASPAGETGMLVVDSVVPGGPADMQLEPGDVLVCMNGKVTTHFLKVETLLDDSVDQKIELQIQRGGTSLTINLMVQDLHSITPDHFLEVGNAVIHPLSYQQARNFRLQCGLVYVSDPGYILGRAGIPQHAIIEKFAGVEISRLEDLISVLSKLSRGTRVPLVYMSYKDRHRRKSALVTADRHEWHDTPMIYTREYSSGLWMARPAFKPESLQLLPHNEFTGMEHMHQAKDEELTNNVPMESSYKESYDEAHLGEEYNIQTQGHFSTDQLVAACSYSLREIKLEETSTKENEDLSRNENSKAASANFSLAELVEPTLVMFEVNVPTSWPLDGVCTLKSSGTGVIVHHSQGLGLVAVDRNIVKIATSDVMLSFAAFPIEIPGEVVFLHPSYNYALVAYDPSALGASGAYMVHAAELLPEPLLCRGDQVYLVGLSRSLHAKIRKSTVTNSCVTLKVRSSMNMEVIELDSDFGSTFTGVLSNEQGKVQALWACFSTESKSGGSKSKDHQFVRGIPIYMISQVVEKIISGANGPSRLINGIKRPMPLLRTLEVELSPIQLSTARSFGLRDDWIQVLLQKDPMRRQVLLVKGCFAGSEAENVLKEDDMLLAVNEEPVTCFRDIDNAIQALENSGENDGKLNITIFRQGCDVHLLVGTDIRDGNGTSHAINWCGCLVQGPHSAVRAFGFLPKEGHGVYVVKLSRGSPAERYGLYSLRWIVEINGKPTPDLDAFINVTRELSCEEHVRVKTINPNGKQEVVTLNQDLHYWPTWELRFDPETVIWRRKMIKGAREQ